MALNDTNVESLIPRFASLAGSAIKEVVKEIRMNFPDVSQLGQIVKVQSVILLMV
jgi:hypothetical protein